MTNSTSTTSTTPPPRASATRLRAMAALIAGRVDDAPEAWEEHKRIVITAWALHADDRKALRGMIATILAGRGPG